MPSDFGPAQMLPYLRLDSGLSQIELGKMAGVSASTINRIERGLTSPSFALMQRIFEVGGHKQYRFEGAGSEAAVTAGRIALGEISDAYRTVWVDTFLDAWRRAGFLGKVARIARCAGAASSVSDRAGRTMTVAYDRSWRAIVDELAAKGREPVVSGLLACGVDKSEAWPVIYVNSFWELLDTTSLKPDRDPTATIWLVSSCDEDRLETVEREGRVFAGRALALVDSYAGGEDALEQANEVAAAWQAELDAVD